MLLSSQLLPLTLVPPVPLLRSVIMSGLCEMYTWIIQDSLMSSFIITSVDSLLSYKVTFTGFQHEDVDIFGAMIQLTTKGVDGENGKGPCYDLFLALWHRWTLAWGSHGAVFPQASTPSSILVIQSSFWQGRREKNQGKEKKKNVVSRKIIWTILFILFYWKGLSCFVSCLSEKIDSLAIYAETALCTISHVLCWLGWHIWVMLEFIRILST